VPLGSFPGIIYDEVTLAFKPNDLFVFCTDGIFEALNTTGAEFGARRLCEVVAASRKESARGIVDAIKSSRRAT
jgi:serine phosphatase RsbU (regulator of sigma subunit)